MRRCCRHDFAGAVAHLRRLHEDFWSRASVRGAAPQYRPQTRWLNAQLAALAQQGGLQTVATGNVCTLTLTWRGSVASPPSAQRNADRGPAGAVVYR
ncbi:MAG: hypothetical protein R2911_39210 [Caldilineaceae bacterium]